MSNLVDTSQAVSCCSAFYEQDWVRHLAGDIFHPGGPELTHRTIAAMGLPAGAHIADLGCGTGTSALMLAENPGLNVSAIDISADNIKRAQDRQLSEVVGLQQFSFNRPMPMNCRLRTGHLTAFLPNVHSAFSAANRLF